MKYFILDPEEQEVLEAFEAGKLKSVPNLKKQMKYYQQIAHNSIQTLAFSILHKYAMS